MAKKAGGKAKAAAAPKEDREGHGKHGVVSSESLERMAGEHAELAKAARREALNNTDPLYKMECGAVARMHEHSAHIFAAEGDRVRKLYVREAK